MKNLRQTPIYRSLNRPNIIMGCEREPILLTGVLVGTLLFVTTSIISVIMGLMIWSFCFFALRKMAKTDPQMSKIYIRHIRYRRYYPAHSNPFALSAMWKRGK